MGVAALGDGTIRWYRLEGQGAHGSRLPFSSMPDTALVLWTPEGLFDHAPNGGQELDARPSGTAGATRHPE